MAISFTTKDSVEREPNTQSKGQEQNAEQVQISVKKLIQEHCKSEAEGQIHEQNVEQVVADLKQPQSTWEKLAHNVQVVTQVHQFCTQLITSDDFNTLPESLKTPIKALNKWCASDFSGGVDFDIFNIVYNQTIQELTQNEGTLFNWTTLNTTCTTIKQSLHSIRTAELDPIYHQLILESYEQMLLEAVETKLKAFTVEVDDNQALTPTPNPLPTPMETQTSTDIGSLTFEQQLKQEINRRNNKKQTTDLEEPIHNYMPPKSAPIVIPGATTAAQTSSSPPLTKMFDEIRSFDRATLSPSKANHASDLQQNKAAKPAANPLEAALIKAMNERRVMIETPDEPLPDLDNSTDSPFDSWDESSDEVPLKAKR